MVRSFPKLESEPRKLKERMHAYAGGPLGPRRPGQLRYVELVTVAATLFASASACHLVSRYASDRPPTDAAVARPADQALDTAGAADGGAPRPDTGQQPTPDAGTSVRDGSSARDTGGTSARDSSADSMRDSSVDVAAEAGDGSTADAVAQPVDGGPPSDQGVDARPAPACRWGSTPYQFSPGMVGCSGAVRWSERQSLCARGVPCTARQWMDLRDDNLAPHNFWTDDNLLDAGGERDCWVSTEVGASCSSSWAVVPMRVCTSDGSDGFGNTCNWTECDWQATASEEYFGGCAGDPTAGTLCCASGAAACAQGITQVQTFSAGMVGCGADSSWFDRAELCGPGSVPCTAARYVGQRGGFEPQANYWTDDILRFDGGFKNCSVAPSAKGGCPTSIEPVSTPMRVCSPYQPDPSGNTCQRVGCGFGNPGTNASFGGCVNDVTAGTLCCS